MVQDRFRVSRPNKIHPNLSLDIIKDDERIKSVVKYEVLFKTNRVCSDHIGQEKQYVPKPNV
jgi:hypothetical protein